MYSRPIRRRWPFRDICIRFTLAGLIPLTSSCSSAPSVQPQVNGLVVANRLEMAKKVLDSQAASYGPNNQLLYWLDRGLVFHFSKDFAESIETFARAQGQFDELYTQSLSKIASTWLVNDYMAPYRGEDFELVLVNVFQALNYVGLGQIQEALVEARDVDTKLSAINSQYPVGQKNVYREDAFARLLMGILYETSGAPEDLNDAFISLVQAADVYERDYTLYYQTGVPRLLKENLLALAQWMGPLEFEEYHARYRDVGFESLKEKRENAEVYLIQDNGLAPLKIQHSFPVPLPDGIVSKIAFPQYKERIYDTAASKLVARDFLEEKEFYSESELCENIAAIAIQNLKNRRLRVFAKAVLRPAAKYMLEKSQESSIRRRGGEGGLMAYKGVSSLYNLSSEQADLRSWQTLPAEIRLARLILKPGQYALRVENFDKNGNRIEDVNLGSVELKKGEKRFFVIRTAR